MRALSVTKQIYLQSLSVYMWLSKSRVTVVTAVILPADSDKMVASGGTYTGSLIYHWPSERPAPVNLFPWKLAI